MRSRNLVEISDDLVVEELSNRYPSSGEMNKRIWKTPYGISFAVPSLRSDEKSSFERWWYYIYDKEGSLLSPNAMNIGEFKGGYIEKGDLLHFVKILDKKEAGFSVYEKPKSLKKLEKIFNVKAELHYLFCLIWHFKIEGKASCSNNPFDLSHAYASGPKEYEVLFQGDNVVKEHLSWRDILSRVEYRYGRPSSLMCQYCKKHSEVILPRCSKCKKVSYCNTECQKLDWTLKKHASICFL